MSFYAPHGRIASLWALQLFHAKMQNTHHSSKVCLCLSLLFSLSSLSLSDWRLVSFVAKGRWDKRVFFVISTQTIHIFLNYNAGVWMSFYFLMPLLRAAQFYITVPITTCSYTTAGANCQTGLPAFNWNLSLWDKTEVVEPPSCERHVWQVRRYCMTGAGTHS